MVGTTQSTYALRDYSLALEEYSTLYNGKHHADYSTVQRTPASRSPGSRVLARGGASSKVGRGKSGSLRGRCIHRAYEERLRNVGRRQACQAHVEAMRAAATRAWLVRRDGTRHTASCYTRMWKPERVSSAVSAQRPYLATYYPTVQERSTRLTFLHGRISCAPTMALDTSCS